MGDIEEFILPVPAAASLESVVFALNCLKSFDFDELHLLPKRVFDRHNQKAVLKLHICTNQECHGRALSPLEWL